MRHTCAAAAGPMRPVVVADPVCPAPPFSRPRYDAVPYVGLDSACRLTLPTWTCACCSQSFSPQARAGRRLLPQQRRTNRTAHS